MADFSPQAECRHIESGIGCKARLRPQIIKDLGGVVVERRGLQAPRKVPEFVRRRLSHGLGQFVKVLTLLRESKRESGSGFGVLVLVLPPALL